MQAAELSPLTFLDGLSPDQLQSLGERFQRRRYRKDERLLTQGACGDEFFAILSGWVRCTRATPRGAVLLGKLGPGRFFGELALVGDGTRAANVEAESDAVCAVLNRDDFLELLRESPAVAEHVRAAIASYRRAPPAAAPA